MFQEQEQDQERHAQAVTRQCVHAPCWVREAIRRWATLANTTLDFRVLQESSLVVGNTRSMAFFGLHMLDRRQ